MVCTDRTCRWRGIGSEHFDAPKYLRRDDTQASASTQSITWGWGSAHSSPSFFFQLSCGRALLGDTYVHEVRLQGVVLRKMPDVWLWHRRTGGIPHTPTRERENAPWPCHALPADTTTPTYRRAHWVLKTKLTGPWPAAFSGLVSVEYPQTKKPGQAAGGGMTAAPNQGIRLLRLGQNEGGGDCHHVTKTPQPSPNVAQRQRLRRKRRVPVSERPRFVQRARCTARTRTSARAPAT